MHRHQWSCKVVFNCEMRRPSAFFYVESVPGNCVLKPIAGIGKAGVWAANEWSDDEPKTERLALSGDSKELAGKFKDAFEGAKVLHAAAREVG